MLLINIIQLEKREILYMINEATRFGAMRLIQKDIDLVTIKVVFNTFKLA
tara:strand:- start:333 stop:482 length:150 start_codon:yes stop_codon:yes gene_type:complete